ncbi:unnamed protein product [Macrosiphum euphorbiae]|uniref:Peptidase C19 ubiquitin carboxyl-terminal hydrolase domain-containing protein n=1 Tax=Macrosiphum euphorbiae TaxID=13131 RepID=A0AAV0WPX7_9HEMI|nr:unnamed protein product [Macrosiphum euphorbiae]
MDSDYIVDSLDTGSLEHLNYKNKNKTSVKDDYEKKVDGYIESISTNFNTINKIKKKCPLYAVGNFPTDESQKCAACDTPVHTLSTCSVYRPGQSGTTLVCLTCSHDVLFADDLTKENKCINLEDAVDKNYGTDVEQQVQVCLDDVPLVITISNVKYELKGICSHSHGMSRLRQRIGHYQSYCKRTYTTNWELYDDLKSKPMPVKANTRVPCEFLVYTI